MLNNSINSTNAPASTVVNRGAQAPARVNAAQASQPAPARLSAPPGGTGLVAKLAAKYGVAVDNFYKALTQVAFPSSQEITPEEMLALLVICDQYQLNPFLKQIYAFKREGKIVPLVGIDGWMAIINRHPDYKGLKVEMSEKMITIDKTTLPEWCDCTILNKRLDMPITMREYADEAFVRTSPVWKSHPKRMLRNRAIVQCARIAFALGGITFIDNDANPWEAMEIDDEPLEPKVSRVKQVESVSRAALPSAVDESTMQRLFEQGLKTGKWERINNVINQRYSIEDQQRIRAYFYSRKGEMKTQSAQTTVLPESSGGAAVNAVSCEAVAQDLSPIGEVTREAAPNAENLSEPLTGAVKRRSGTSRASTPSGSAEPASAILPPADDDAYLDALTSGLDENAMI